MQSENISYKFNEKNSIHLFHYKFISGLGWPPSDGV